MKISKGIVDYGFALSGLVILLLPLLVIFILASISTGKNGIFIQERIGQGGKSFLLYKFRTMTGFYTSYVTTDKMQITPLGKFLRKYKLDELPQLINILKGDMSLVGPRPDVKGYADELEGEDRIILSVKPGITGPAQLKYRNEEEILSRVEDPQQYNDEVIWKDKIQINKEYVKNWSFTGDFRYIWQTLFS